MRIVHRQPSVGLPIKYLVVKQRKLCPKHRLGPLERRVHLVSFGIKSIP